MRVAVLGCGSMGTILGAFLTKGGCAVEMIDNYKEHVDALNAKGAYVSGFAEMKIPVKALVPEQMQGVYDVVFLFTKQTDNSIVLPNLLNYLKEDGVVCTLQNGVPEPYVAKYVGKERTVGGTVLWSATFVGPGESKLTQNLETLDHFFSIGEMDGKITERIKKISEILSLMGPVEITSELMASRWQKLIYNACVSGMSAAIGATFGEVVNGIKSSACAVHIGNEVKKCCEAEGYKMPPLLMGYSPELLNISDEDQFKDAVKMFYNIYQVALAAKASMLQDLEKGKKTEVEMINGYVSEIGKKHKIPTPFCDAVVNIVNKIETKKLPLSEKNINYFDDSWFKYKFVDPKKIK